MGKRSADVQTDSFAYKFATAIYRWFAVSILWFLCSIPIVTIGAASSAALSEFADPGNSERHPLVADFFRTFRRIFLQSTAIWCAVLITAFILILDITFYEQVFAVGTTVSQVVRYLLLALLLGLMGWDLAVDYRLANAQKGTLRELLLSAGKLALMCLPVIGTATVLEILGIVLLIKVPFLLISLLIIPGLLADIQCRLIGGFLKRYERAEVE